MDGKIIYATFTGEDGSMGYNKGEEYELYIFQTDKIWIWIADTSREEQKSSECPYSSIETFLSNWTNIKVRL